jgi:hypothetical protein
VQRSTGLLAPADVWLATTDADTLVPPSWLRRQLHYADRGWDAVAGTVRVTDWSGHRPAVRSLFHQRYAAGAGPHPPVHGANLGFRASAYQSAGGFPDEPTAVSDVTSAWSSAVGSRVLHTGAVTVITSARCAARAPHGFSGYLRALDAEVDAARHESA